MVTFYDRVHELENKTQQDWDSGPLVYPAESSIRLEYVPRRRWESTPMQVGVAEVVETSDGLVTLTTTYSLPRYQRILQWILIVPASLFGLLGVVVVISGMIDMFQGESDAKQLIVLIGTGTLMLCAALRGLGWVTDSGYPSTLSELFERELELVDISK